MSFTITPKLLLNELIPFFPPPHPQYATAWKYLLLHFLI